METVQGTMQGSGKVRLIAKGGRYRETDFTTSNRKKMLDLKNREVITDKDTPEQRQAKIDTNTRRQGAQDYFANEQLTGQGLENYYIEFDNTPDISESGSASYYEIGEIRGPGSVLMYMGSPSRTFSISAKLIARTSDEAYRVDRQIHMLKSWRMPESYLGGIASGTPTILYLQGYGKMFKDIPVVLTDLSIEFSSEYDYIAGYTSSNNSSLVQDVLSYEQKYNAQGQRVYDVSKPIHTYVKKEFNSAVPIITSVSITLKEAHAVENVDGLDSFDILQYRNGDLMAW